MKGYGLLIVMAFVFLTLAIVVNTCTVWPLVSGPSEGFVVNNVIKEMPSPLSLTNKQTVTGVTGVAELPSAPITGLASVNALPQTDPAMEKSSTAMLSVLKGDMDGFYKNEYPHMKEMSDPAIKLPLTRFLGDYQRVKDELTVLKNNEGIPAQISIQELSDIGANLRYIQRTYRSLATVELVPPTTERYSQVGAEVKVEGFADPNGSGYSEDTEPITLTQLKLLSTAIGAEILRLQASGTTDPVINARVSIFTKINQTVSDILTKIGNGSMAEKDIPIKKKDYNNFLPALGDSSAGIGGLLSSSGYGSLSNLFNAYDVGDASGAEVAAALFERYTKDMLKGLSYNVTVSYTSDNDVKKQRALASYAKAYASSKLHPGTEGARGDFDNTVRELDEVSGFENGENSVRPPSVSGGKVGSFDWKARAEAITDAIQRAGMNPSDYGCLEKGAHVSAGYGWRGHAKMICSRLATNADPAIPEQMGCPPVSWRGWRS